MKRISLVKPLQIISLLLVSLSLHFSVSAQTAEEFGAVINLSGKQRMLTQKMSKEVMLVALDIEKQSNLNNLAKTSSLFDKTLMGLRDGDSGLGLPATESKRILRQLKKIDAKWQAFYPNIKTILANNTVEQAQLDAIGTQNLPLLKEMNKAVGAYEKEAAKGGMKADPGLAASLNLSGKQRMLTQKMSKEFLMVAHGYDVVNNRLNLLETYTLFERTLSGLSKGDETLGLPPTTNADINTQLDVVKDLWQEAKPVFERASKDAYTPTSDDIKVVAKLNLPLLKEMNKAVGMYEQLAK
ncbi:MAG: type IV pili methyl-accepting chemotaxis transducer N-terminal domain-containing protein [Glaciecola sp.]